MMLTGNGLVENVFIDDRTSGERTEIGGIISPRPHTGDIEIRNTFIAGCGNNAVCASGPDKEGGNEGTVRLYNCYHRDNTVSQFRIGTPGSLVENCIGVVDDPEGLRGHYPNTDSQRARGIWCRNMPDNTVRNSVMYVDPDDADPWGNYMVEHFHKSIGDEAVLNVVGNYLLIPVYGIVGAAVATSLSYGSMFLLQVACARYLGYSPLEDIRPVRLLATVVVAGPVIFGIERALPSNVIALALVPPLGFLVFAVVAVWTGVIDGSELREATSILPALIGTRVRTFVFDWKWSGSAGGSHNRVTSFTTFTAVTELLLPPKRVDN